MGQRSDVCRSGTLDDIVGVLRCSDPDMVLLGHDAVVQYARRLRPDCGHLQICAVVELHKPHSHGTALNQHRPLSVESPWRTLPLFARLIGPERKQSANRKGAVTAFLLIAASKMALSESNRHGRCH